jgi:hypothetical protein
LTELTVLRTKAIKGRIGGSYSCGYEELKVDRGFGGECHLHDQGLRITRARNKYEAGNKQESA